MSKHEKKLIPLYSASGLDIEIYDTDTSWFLSGDLDFYRKVAEENGGPLLELACGTGRLLWPLAEAGLDVVGLDLSEAMLAAARQKASDYPQQVRERVQLLEGNMEHFDLDDAFGIVLIAFRSFQHLLTPEAERSALRCIHKHLRPGGLLVINVFDPLLEYCIPNAPIPKPEGVKHPQSKNVVLVKILQRQPDPLHQRLFERWIFQEIDRQGSIIREDERCLELRWIFRQEMRYLFELTGFHVEDELSDFYGSPPAYGKEQIWLARKV